MVGNNVLKLPDGSYKVKETEFLKGSQIQCQVDSDMKLIIIPEALIYFLFLLNSLFTVDFSIVIVTNLHQLIENFIIKRKI